MTGIAFIVVGALLLAFSALIGSILSGTTSGCTGPGCTSFDPSSVFLWLGLPFLILGLVLAALGFWWALR